MSTFGERLKTVRGDRSQAAFAKDIGIPQVTLSNYETNKTEPKFKLLQTIVSIFCINIEWLMIGTGHMHSSDAPQLQEPHGRLPTATHEVVALCPRCTKLEVELEMERSERRVLSGENRELNAENRHLWKENGDLRERCAKLEERQAGCTLQNSYTDTNVLETA